MAVLTHMLQVSSDHGTWVDDLGLWGCLDASAAAAQARDCKRLPGRTIWPDRDYRVVDVTTGEPTPVDLI